MGMDPVTASIAGPVIGSAVGGMFGNKAAKQDRAAQQYATDMNNRGYNDARPFVTDMYKGGTNALNNMLDTGAYGGPTYAGMNDMQRNTMGNMYNFGNSGFSQGQGLMNTAGGFGQNYSDLYNQAGQDRMATAQQYAMNNSQPLVDRALRDSTRNLQENTLTSIGMGASATGNTNSSRAGVAEAIAGRDYMDRAADTTANINDTLMQRSLKEQDASFRNQMNANQALGNTFNTGFGMNQDSLKMMGAAGDIQQKDAQSQMNADKTAFDNERDFALDAYNKYNAGILGRAPQTSSQQANMHNPLSATMGGAMAGFGFGQQYLQPMMGGNNNYMPSPYGQYGTTGATGMSGYRPYTDNRGFGVA